MFRRILVLAMCLGLSVASAEAADKYKFDKNHTNILFFANHLGFSNPSGKFTEYDGYLVLDEEVPEESYVEITIYPKSIMTGLPDFDKHLRSNDFFYVDKYPEVKFKSTKVEKIKSNMALVYGELTLLGKTNPVTLAVTLNKIGNNPRTGDKTVGFSAKTTIKRSLWGMNYGVPLVGDDVDIMIETETILDKE